MILKSVLSCDKKFAMLWLCSSLVISSAEMRASEQKLAAVEEYVVQIPLTQAVLPIVYAYLGPVYGVVRTLGEYNKEYGTINSVVPYDNVSEGERLAVVSRALPRPFPRGHVLHGQMDSGGPMTQIWNLTTTNEEPAFYSWNACRLCGSDVLRQLLYHGNVDVPADSAEDNIKSLPFEKLVAKDVLPEQDAGDITILVRWNGKAGEMLASASQSSALRNSVIKLWKPRRYRFVEGPLVPRQGSGSMVARFVNWRGRKAAKSAVAAPEAAYSN